jgi:hypothetical protein
MQRIFIKKRFLFTVGSVCRVKRFTEEEVEAEERKWQRQQSKDFCAVSFDGLVERRDRFINVGGGYVEK